VSVRGKLNAEYSIAKVDTRARLGLTLTLTSSHQLRAPLCENHAVVTVLWAAFYGVV